MKAPGFTAVLSRTTVQDAVHAQIRHALMTGRFDPGEVLTIAALADAFGTSHMPVRQALRRLAAENALEIAPNGSAHVPAVSHTRLDDIARARIAVEGLATELAVPHITARDLARLAGILAEHQALRTADGVYAMLAKNQEFHFAIYALSRSDVLVQLIESLWLRFGPYMRLLTRGVAAALTSDQGDVFFRHHHDLLEALTNGDAGAARAALEADIRASISLLRGMAGATLAGD